MSEKIEKVTTYNLLYFFLILILGSIIGPTMYFVDMKTSESSRYFEYISLKTNKLEYQIDEPIFITSDIYRKKPLYMSYSDILRCTFDGVDYTWFSSVTTYGKKIDSIGKIKSQWRYEGKVPITPANCYIDSHPTAELLFGIKKTQNIRSNNFTIVDTNDTK